MTRNYCPIHSYASFPTVILLNKFNERSLERILPENNFLNLSSPYSTFNFLGDSLSICQFIVHTFSGRALSSKILIINDGFPLHNKVFFTKIAPLHRNTSSLCEIFLTHIITGYLASFLRLFLLTFKGKSMKYRR